jgi:hypothetical protein
MADIPGVRELRLLEGQPIAFGTMFGSDISHAKSYTLEITFDDLSIQNVVVSKVAYDGLLQRLKKNNVVLAQHMAARGETVSEKKHEPVKEKPLPLDVTPKAALAALQEVSEPAPATNRSALLYKRKTRLELLEELYEQVSLRTDHCFRSDTHDPLNCVGCSIDRALEVLGERDKETESEQKEKKRAP